MNTDDVEVTEIVELRAAKVSGVASPANGTPFLLLKAAAEKGESEDIEDLVTKDEADDIEEEVTDSAAKQAEWEALDKALSAADRAKMPASSFAFIDKKGGKHLPIHDKGHVIAAKGRVNQQDFSEAKGDPDAAKATAESKIEAKAKSLGIGAKKGAVQDALHGTATPQEAGHEPATGQSGLAGSVVTGERAGRPDSSLTLGGETTSQIPDMAKVDHDSPIPTSTDGAGVINPQILKSAMVVASLMEAMDVLDSQREAIKDGKFLQTMNGPSEPAIPLTEVASTLAACCRTLEEHLLCERVEAAIDPTEQSDVWDMEDAKCALESALRLVANIAIMESLEDDSVTKAGKVLSAKNVAALEAAHKHLTGVIEAAQDKAGSSGENAEKEILSMADVTKDELSTMIAASSVEAVRQVLKERRKADKRARKEAEAAAEAETAEKGNVSAGTTTGGSQSNNAGEVEPKANGETDADDVNAVKSEDETGDEVGSALKQVGDQLTELTKSFTERLGSVEETVAKIAKRPRSGGPSLDGKARGASPAAEGRLSDATKGEQDNDIEQLKKSLDEEKDPVRKSELGLKLTYAKLMQMHEQGRL